MANVKDYSHHKHYLKSQIIFLTKLGSISLVARYKQIYEFIE